MHRYKLDHNFMILLSKNGGPENYWGRIKNESFNSEQNFHCILCQLRYKLMHNSFEIKDLPHI